MSKYAMITPCTHGYLPGLNANLNALDVYENEPELEPGLSGLDNVVIVPHIASATIETRTNMGLIAVRNIIAVFDGETPPNCVNPEILKGK